MPRDPLIELGLHAYVAFFALMAVVLGLLVFRHGRRERRTRERYFSQFDARVLRMSPNKIRLVYRVVTEGDDGHIVVPIRDQNRPAETPTELCLPEAALCPFDRDRFT